MTIATENCCEAYFFKLLDSVPSASEHNDVQLRYPEDNKPGNYRYNDCHSNKTFAIRVFTVSYQVSQLRVWIGLQYIHEQKRPVFP